MHRGAEVVQQPQTAAHAGLAHLPLALFAAPMGVGGLGLAWREAAHGLRAPALVGEALLLAAGLLWVVIAALHLVRLLRHPAALAADLRHPIRSAFAGAVTIGLMIMAGGLMPYARGAAEALWLAAVVGHVAIAAWTVRGLLSAPRDAATLTPPLLIPLVGNILAPIFGVRLGFEALSWLMFGIGALLWLMLQPPLLGRLITGPALPPRLRPTLAILLAPPAAGAVALASLTGSFGPGPLALFGFALLLAMVLASMSGDFAHLPFAMSWWGWTFPAAVFAVAAQGAARAWPAAWQVPVLWLLLLAASLIVAIVIAATSRAALRGHLLQPEG
jgi:tellurite resistance protein